MRGPRRLPSARSGWEMRNKAEPFADVLVPTATATRGSRPARIRLNVSERVPKKDGSAQTGKSYRKLVFPLSLSLSIRSRWEASLGAFVIERSDPIFSALFFL